MRRVKVGRAVDLLLVFACGGAAYALSVHAGRIGYMPLDQSIVFDGAWRVLNGQVPWRDFMTPNGLVPIVLQAGIFAVAGVSWSAYVAHAGLVNAAAAMAVCWFLRTAGLGALPSLAAGLATAAWLYPVMGTPYMDQHSLFFAGIAVLACWRAAEDGRRRWWIAGGIAAALALLSKQIPALLILPLCGVALFITPWRRAVSGLTTSVLSSLVALVIILAPLVASGAALVDIIEFGWLVPAEIGQLRRANAPGLMPWVVAVLKGAMPFGYWGGMVLLGLTIGALLLHTIDRRGRVNPSLGASVPWSLAGVTFVVVTLLSCALTTNAPDLQMGSLPLAVALMLVGFRRAALAGFGQTRPVGTRVALEVVAVAVSILLLTDAVKGYRALALTRQAHDMVISSAERAAPLSAPRLKAAGFSTWKLPTLYQSAGESFESLLEFFARRPGNLVLVGDESILYGLTGRPSVTPILWFHPGLTFRESPPTYTRLDAMFEENLRRYSVRWVVIPANTSWIGWDEHTSRVLAARLAGRRCERIGTYRVCDIL
jgi:4-amino-4-deoxy-L-arabinose transferase-like glycosyltransferase